MIGVYATCQVKAGLENEFRALAQQFINESRSHKGCESYDCGEVSNSANQYCFIERWATQADLDAHLASPFFTANAPKLVAMLDGELSIHTVDLL